MRPFLLLLISWITIWNVAQAQITYTSASFPLPGDILPISTTNDSTVTITPPSAVATAWDFSFLVAQNTTNDTILAASTGANFSQFPTTDVLQPFFLQFGTTYADVTANQIVRLGGGIEIGGISIVNAYSDPHITQTVPLTYNDAASDTYAFYFGDHIDSIPFLRPLIDSLVSNLPFNLNPDSIRLNINGDESRLVDAWGTCAMRDSTYDVLRQRVETAFQLKIEVRVVVPFLGAQWADVTSFLPLPVPTNATLVRYDFLSEGVKQPIVSITLDSAEANITSIEFLDTIVNNPPNTINVRYVQNLMGMQLYPNPAQQYLQVDLLEATPLEGYSLSLVDVLGRVVLEQNGLSGQQQQLDVNTLANGTYTLVLRDRKGSLLGREVIKVRH